MALHLHVSRGANHFCGKRNCEIDSRSDRHVNVVMKQNSVGGNIVGFRVALPGLRLNVNGKFHGKTRRALHFGEARPRSFGGTAGFG